MNATELYAEVAKLTSEGRPFVLATVIESAGSTPQKPGSKMIILEGGVVRGTIGGGAIEQQIIDAAGTLFAAPESSKIIETHLTHDLGMCCGGRMKVFLEKHAAAARLWIFGAGHVGTEVARLAAHVGFRVTVVDERPEWNGRQRFADDVTVIAKNPADYAKDLAGGDDCYFCVTTHDHPLDQAVLEALLTRPSAYLGVIGSRRKAEKFRQRLLAAGFDAAALDRVRSPMGVSIKALTPAEISVSIVAELIAARRQHPRRG